MVMATTLVQQLGVVVQWPVFGGISYLAVFFSQKKPVKSGRLARFRPKRTDSLVTF
jgi:hypothetical protein